MTARVAKDHLRAFIERIERLEEEKKALADDIRDVYAEAKAHGFDTKALRTIVSLRKQDIEERKEHEAILETYMQALGMLDGHYAGEPGPAEVQKRTGPSQRTQAERDAINERAANWKRPTRRSTSRPCVARSQTITSSASRPLLEGRHAETGAPSLAVEERDGAPDLSPRHVRPLRMPGPRPGHSVRSPPDPGGGVSSLPRPSG